MALSILLQVSCILHFIHILLLLPVSCPERVLCVLCDFNSEQTHLLRHFLQLPCIQYTTTLKVWTWNCLQVKSTALTALLEFSVPLGIPHILVFIWMLIKTICFYSIADKDHPSWEQYTRITQVLRWGNERCHCRNLTDKGQRKRRKSIKISSNCLRTFFYWMYFHKIAQNRLLAYEFYLVNKKS